MPSCSYYRRVDLLLRRICVAFVLVAERPVNLISRSQQTGVVSQCHLEQLVRLAVVHAGARELVYCT